MIDWCKKHPGGYLSDFKIYWASIEKTSDSDVCSFLFLLGPEYADIFSLAIQGSVCQCSGIQDQGNSSLPPLY
jgi:hypothetical protein